MRPKKLVFTGHVSVQAIRIAAEPRTSGCAEDEAELQDREDQRYARRTEIVRQDRIGTGAVHRATRADEQPRADELAEILREAAKRGDRADERDASGQDIFARKDVDQTGQRHAEQDEGDQRSPALHEAEHTVRDNEALLHPLGEHLEDSEIEEIEESREDNAEQGRKKPPALGWPGIPLDALFAFSLPARSCAERCYRHWIRSPPMAVSTRLSGSPIRFSPPTGLTQLCHPFPPPNCYAWESREQQGKSWGENMANYAEDRAAIEQLEAEYLRDGLGRR